MVRTFRLPLGVHDSLNGVYRPVKGLEKAPVKALPIQETLEKARVVARRYGLEITHDDLRIEPKEIASEVGDDEINVSNSHAKLAFNCVIYSEMNMKCSWSDTSISPHYGNFAEDLIVLPSSYSQTWLNNRKARQPGSLAYLDVPKLRLAIDIRPMRMDHSSTNDGKVSMVASRLHWIDPVGPIYGIYNVFSIFQDVNLGLIRDKKFPYLPPQLGGYGKKPPFDRPGNLERFLHSYKQGAHSELIREVILRTQDYLTELESGTDPPKDPLLSHIARYQSSFHDWVKGKSIYAPTTWIDIPAELEEFRVSKTGINSLVDEAVARLVADRQLVTESQLQIAVEHNEMCKSLVTKTNVLESRKIRDEARREWMKLSIFSMESYGMIKEIGLEYPNRLRKLEDREVLNFYSRVNATRGFLKQLLREESVYDRRAMDKVYEDGPMHVHFQMMPKVGISARGFAAQSREYRDTEDTEFTSALDDLYDWVVDPERASKEMPRKIVNDDNPIIELCHRNRYNVIITDDIKLCRKAAAVTRNIIFRVPCIWYYSNVYFGQQDWSSELNRLAPGSEWQTLNDEGSIQSFEEKGFRDGVMIKNPSFARFNIWKDGSNWKDPEVWEEYWPDDTPSYDLKSLLFDTRNQLRQRRNVRIQPGRSFKSSNWRSSN